MKYCVKCKETKDDNEYYQHIRSDNGRLKLSSYCKPCELQHRKKPKKVHKKTCISCKKDFISGRIDKNFCNDNCRSIFYNKEHKTEIKLLKIKTIIKNKHLEKYKKKWNEKERLLLLNFNISNQDLAKKLKRPIASIYCFRSRLNKILNSKLTRDINYLDNFQNF